MAEYADAFPRSKYTDPVGAYLEERLAALKARQEAEQAKQTIETEAFILTFTGSLADVIDQLQRRVLLA